MAEPLSTFPRSLKFLKTDVEKRPAAGRMSRMKIISTCLTLAAVLVLAALVSLRAFAQGQSQSTQASKTQVEHVDADGAAKLIADKKAVVLDVRTPKEYEAGHIAGAKLIDFNAADFAKKLGELDKNKTYLVHCAAGGRSTKSLEVFKKLEFKSVVHLDGGFKAWEKAGKPVEK